MISWMQAVEDDSRRQGGRRWVWLRWPGMSRPRQSTLAGWVPDESEAPPFRGHRRWHRALRQHAAGVLSAPGLPAPPAPHPSETTPHLLGGVQDHAPLEGLQHARRPGPGILHRPRRGHLADHLLHPLGGGVGRGGGRRAGQAARPLPLLLLPGRRAVAGDEGGGGPRGGRLPRTAQLELVQPLDRRIHVVAILL